VTKWRNGFVVGEAVEITTRIRDLADLGQIVLTDPAAAPLAGRIDLEPFTGGVPEHPPIGRIWALRL
jgi:hypothetical protein